jgi:hypothetical protein
MFLLFCSLITFNYMVIKYLVKCMNKFVTREFFTVRNHSNFEDDEDEYEEDECEGDEGECEEDVSTDVSADVSTDVDDSLSKSTEYNTVDYSYSADVLTKSTEYNTTDNSNSSDVLTKSTEYDSINDGNFTDSTTDIKLSEIDLNNFDEKETKFY